MQLLITAEEIELLKKIKYQIGNEDTILEMPSIPAKVPFSHDVIEFFDQVSKELLHDHESKAFPDVITLGFWLRKASLIKMKEAYCKEDGNIHLGRGIAFHIAPSNVPVNYAYSLVAGMLTGNANIVRVPSKDFPQVSIINRVLKSVLMKQADIRPYIVLVKYDRNQSINDLLSRICDTRIIWGGDNTISELRKSPLMPRASEITFADRYSVAVINAEAYLENENKTRIAQEFYNDTYLTDQNACTSPRIIVWTGENRTTAKKLFWSELHNLAEKNYHFQPIQGVNKLTSSYLAAAELPGVQIENRTDNLIVRVNIKECTSDIMNLKDNSGYFFEYDCNNIMEIRDLCDDKKCQTIGYLCDQKIFEPLVLSGVKGIDRIVPIGTTMNFELIWDGYDLTERLSRTIKIK